MDKKLKLRSQKILYIFDKMWWCQKKGRYYNVPKRKYINTTHKYYYRRLKIEVFLGIKYFDPTSRKRFKSVKALENLINHSDELLALLNKKDLPDITNHLIIPNDLLQISDIKVKSIRISEKIEADFNDFCDEFKQYSKTSLLNFALVEFMEKYKEQKNAYGRKSKKIN